MSKRITTRWYIGAWVVWLLGLIALFIESRISHAGSTAPPGTFPTYVVMLVAALVMLVTWIAALLRLAVQHSWGWCVAILILQLLGLGVIGMAAYALSGPADQHAEIVYRPRAT
jgi:hypothetical protein